MWTAYTRETPAHPRWTLATMSIAFAATLALAQWQVHDSSKIDLTLHPPVKLPGWPATFRLPAACEWERIESGDDLLSKFIRLSTGSDQVAFEGTGLPGGSRLIQIGYSSGGRKNDVRTRAVEEFGFDAKKVEAFTANGVQGVKQIDQAPFGARIQALLKLRPGVWMHVEYATPGSASREIQLFDRLCEGIKPTEER